LAELPDDVRAELLTLAREIAEGKTNFGEVKRGHKLIGKHTAEIEERDRKIESLQQQLAESKAQSPTSNVGGLFKSVAEVEKREEQLQGVLDWCEDNAEGGDSNGQSFSAEEVKQMRRQARDEMKKLPGQKQQLQQQAEQQAQFTQQQQSARSEVFKLLPELKDPENPETQRVNEMITKMPMLKSMFVSPEMAALTWQLGEAALKERLAKRSGGRTGQAGKPTVQSPKPKVAGQVKTGRPASGAGTGASARPAAGTTVASAKERIGNERSVGSLAGLIGAAGL
jgi:hypothetical protein